MKAELMLCLLLLVGLTSASCVEPEESDAEVVDAQFALDDFDPDDPGVEGYPPIAPSGTFKLTSKTATSVTMSWHSPLGATATKVQRRLGTGAWTTVRNYGVTSGTVAYTNGGLSQDTRVCYRVVVTNEYGSRTSTERCAVTDRPGSPSFSRVRLEIQVADVTDAGTDDRVGVSLNDTWWANFTGLSYSHDDLERNSTFRYDLGFRNLESLHDIANITIKKFGTDGLCLRSFRLLLDEVPVFSRTFGNTASTCHWLDDDSETTGRFHVGHAELRATPSFVGWQPPVRSLVVSQEEIEERLEGIMGNLIWSKDEAKWGEIYGEAVEVSAHPTLDQWIVVDFDLEGDSWGPNPEVDIDLHLHVHFVPDGAGWRLVFESTYFAANVDFAWWAEVIISLGTIVCGPATGQECVGLLEGHIEDEIEAGFKGISEDFSVDTGDCATPGVRAQADGSLIFFCAD
ncbi:MAG: fibronectin type III domain-containing protein [Myxococcales bacterium]|nr:fibronectin type III domain-containing protein [Myxococcales bacterium]